MLDQVPFMLDSLPPPTPVIECDSALYVKSALIATDFVGFLARDEISIKQNQNCSRISRCTDKRVTSSVHASYLATDRVLQGGYPERLSTITLEWPIPISGTCFSRLKLLRLLI
jgi:hypothetical protein